MDISYNNIISSFKEVIKSVVFNVKTRINSSKNTSATGKIYNFVGELAHGLEFFVLAILVIFILPKRDRKEEKIIKEKEVG